MTPRSRQGLGVALALTAALALLPAAASGHPRPGGSGSAQDGDGAGRAAGPPGPTAPAAVATDRVLVTVDDPEELAAVRGALAGRGAVRRIAPRVLLAAGPRDEVTAAVGADGVVVERDRAVVAAAGPNDPHYPRQWALENTGQPVPDTPLGTEGRTGLDVGARRAWAHTTGSAGVTVAVVDTAVEPHRDLAADLLEGKSFAPDSATGCPAVAAAHGAEVAGAAAAVTHNEVGIAGLASRTRILPVAFLDACGRGTLVGAIRAISWAGDHGADVIVASFASSGSPPEEEVAALRAAIEDAGVPLVAAAGNAEAPGGSGRDLSADGADPVYPASFDLRNQLAVAAVDHHGEMPSYSNYGEDHVELGAPGNEIYTTTIDATGDDAYAYADGTSYAAPYVAGAVALALGLEPVLTSEAVLDLTRRTTRPLDALEGRVGTGGMLDAGQLVTAVADGGACPTERVPVSGFDDVDAASVHALGVDCLAWWDVARGRTATTFAPRSTVTRGQLASFLAAVVDAAGATPDPAPHPFPDVAGSVHEDGIATLATLGVVHGFPDGTYRPSAPVTRAQMASFLVNVYEELAGEAPLPSPRWFRDTEGSVHARAAESLWELGITAGTGTRTYAPNRDVRRDQMASFVARLLDRLVREELVAGR